MKTRLFSFIMILALSASFVMAQSTEKGKTSFAILGGLNFQNLNGKASNGDKLANSMILGYHFGGNVQIPIAPEFYFQPGLMFTTKGAKNSLSTTKLSYIEMPMNMVYKALLGSGYVMVGFGPYIAYGMGGKETSSGSSVTLKSGTDIKAFDAGGNIFVGYEMASGMFFQLNTQFGMLKINPTIPNDKSSVKNTGFGLSLGYRF